MSEQAIGQAGAIGQPTVFPYIPAAPIPRPIPQVYAAIAGVMGKLSKVGIGKDNKNTQQGYKFRGIDDVYNALAPLLSAEKLLILPRVLSRMVTERETKNGGVLFYVVLDVEFDLVSGVDGSKHTIRVCGEAMDSGDKATNKAMSAAYKYACMEAFCIPTEGDNDADASTHEVVKGTTTDPRGEEWKKVDTKLVNKYVSLLMDAIDNDRPEAVKELSDELSQEPNTKIAVWHVLQKPTKDKIRDILDQRKAA